MSAALFALKRAQACPTERCQLTNLSVRKDGGVVALEATLDESLCAVGVDGPLLRVHIKHVVKGEGFVLTEEHLWFSGHHIRTDVAALNFLLSQLRTDPKKKKKRERRRDILTVQVTINNLKP